MNLVSNRFDLSGQVAAITGATRGIGRAMALALAEAGADVALLQRDPGNLQVQREIEALGRRCVIIPCDLDQDAQVKQAIPEVLSAYNRLDILVNNAGIQRRYPAVDFPEEAWDEVIRVNLRTVWILAQQAGRHMVEQGRGKIINTASLLSFQGGITVPAYAAAKGAVAQLTKALSNEWAKHNVNVNAIVPGYINTDMNVALLEDPVRSRQILERIPAGRWGIPEDFSGTVVYLASRASDYVHGHLLAVDGGWLGR
ncbi:MAG: glucose 1-dehydrogenase [Paenibacillus sp.]|jgi:2-deoxy-D-gluconate 3-dehydrogenase|nr:glucose 1-dehydrogenase [Paenibacillus sp.]